MVKIIVWYREVCGIIIEMKEMTMKMKLIDLKPG